MSERASGRADGRAGERPRCQISCNLHPRTYSHGGELYRGEAKTEDRTAQEKYCLRCEECRFISKRAPPPFLRLVGKKRRASEANNRPLRVEQIRCRAAVRTWTKEFLDQVHLARSWIRCVPMLLVRRPTQDGSNKRQKKVGSSMVLRCSLGTLSRAQRCAARRCNPISAR